MANGDGEDAERSESVNFIYSIEDDSQLDIHELVPILSGLAEVIQESYRILNPVSGDVRICVKPFEEGSFPIELLLSEDTRDTLYAAYQAGGVSTIITALQTVGLIKSTVSEFVSLLELLKKLKGQSPQAVESKDDGTTFEVKGHDNDTTMITAPVERVYNNSIIANNLTVIYGNTFEKPGREKVRSFIKDDPESVVEVTKQDAPALKDIPPSPTTDCTPEEAEHTYVAFLNPKRGSFDGEGDKWTFRKGGRQGEIIKANIKDSGFLEELASGEKRLSGGDLLKVELHEKQRVVGSQIRTTNHILKVLDYKPAPPSPKQRSLFDGQEN
jgi:hypothetical protein